GTAADMGGVVAAVEVSVDGGASWHTATGRNTWTYEWRPTTVGTVALKSRATDDTGNVETPGAGASVNVITAASCPCSIWSTTTTPTSPAVSDGTPIEVGLKFRSDISGYIT